MSFLPLQTDGKPDKRLEEYIDDSGVSTKHLDWGIWYLKNKGKFFTTLVWLLIVIAAVLWGYSLYFFAHYMFVGRQQDKEVVSGNQTVVAPKIHYDAGLDFGLVKRITLENGTADLVGVIENSNSQVWADFDYYFAVGDGQTKKQRGFVYPEEEKYLLELAVPMNNFNGPISLVVENVGWNKLNRHRIPDWEFFRENHLEFEVQDTEFLNFRQSGLSEKRKLNSVSFKVINRNPYNYKQADFQVILRNGTDIVGVTAFAINNFSPNEKEEVAISLLGEIYEVSRVEVLPNINIFDNSIYNDLY